MTKIHSPSSHPSPRWGEGRVRGVLVIGKWSLFGICDLGFAVKVIDNAHYQRGIKGAKISDTEESVTPPHL
jgi:hypothetical protein